MGVKCIFWGARVKKNRRICIHLTGALRCVTFPKLLMFINQTRETERGREGRERQGKENRTIKEV